MRTIAILGDSSSSGIGAGKAHYPYRLYQSLSKKINVKIENYSVPGLTSSDAASCYHRKIKKGSPDCVIIYLGNNDCSAGLPKRYVDYRFRPIISMPFLGRKEKALKSYEHKKKYQFRNRIAPLSTSVSPDNFRKNMSSMIRDAKRRRGTAIMVCPAANRYFPGGLGTENSIFFKSIGSKEKVACLLRPADEESCLLIEGIGHQEENHREDMLRCYRKLIAKGGASQASFIARNNLAVYFASLEPERTKSELLGLLDIYVQYDAAIYYNLHLLCGIIGDARGSGHFLNQAYESDGSLYRIKDKYREIIIGLSKRHDVPCLDLKQILKEDDFIDYCHPTLEGHEKIARSLEGLIIERLPPAPAPDTAENKYEDIFISPNHCLARNEDLVDYYTIDYPLPPAAIRQELTGLLREFKFEDFSLRKNMFDDVIGKCGGNPLRCYLINFMLANTGHPVFNQRLDLLAGYLPYSHEVLSFPEFYLYRILFNYFLFCEKEISVRVSAAAPRSSDYERMIMRHNAAPLRLELNTDPEYLRLIEKGINIALRGPFVFEDIIDFRIKTVIHWYTREAFRYGTHSRLSMLYGRSEIDRLIEASVAGLAISFSAGADEKTKRFQMMLKAMDELISIHDFHVNRRVNKEKFDHEDYCASLLKKKKECIELAGLFDAEKQEGACSGGCAADRIGSLI